MRHILAILFLFISTTASASELIKVQRYQLGTVLPSASLNGSALTFYVDRTKDPTKQGYSVLEMDVYYTHANNGALTATCTVGETQTTATVAPTTCVVTSGVCAVKFAGVMTTDSLSASKNYGLVLGIGSSPVVKCVMSHGGSAAAGDKVIVIGRLTN